MEGGMLRLSSRIPWEERMKEGQNKEHWSVVINFFEKGFKVITVQRIRIATEASLIQWKRICCCDPGVLWRLYHETLMIYLKSFRCMNSYGVLRENQMFPQKRPFLDT